MGADPIVIDTIHENPLKWTGSIKDFNRTDRGKQPIIKKKTTSLWNVLWPGRWNADLYPYELDPSTNIKRISGVASTDIVLLIPSKNIPEYSEKDYKNSFYHNHLETGDSQRIEALEDDLKEEQQKVNRLRRQLDKEREDDDDDKESSSGPPMLECRVCDKSSRKSSWESDDQNDEEYCPKCGSGVMDNAKRVN